MAIISWKLRGCPPEASKLADSVAFGDRTSFVMVYVYVLRGVGGYRYVGITKNLSRRLREHNRGKNQSTRTYRPFRVLVSEKYLDYTKARERERFLKSGVGRKLAKQNARVAKLADALP